MVHPGSIVILDFGGQYAHLIARRVREAGAYSEIRPPETPVSELHGAAGFILSGGPQSVYDEGSPQADPRILQLGIPVLGLCYGLHWITHVLGGEVKSGKVKEYGRMPIRIVHGGGILRDCGEGCTVWMSHGDEAVKLPDGFTLMATSDSCKNAAFGDESRHLYALQFHPEVTHTEHGRDILRTFVELCKPAPWSVENFAARIGAQMREEVDGRKVFMLVSGGVDSTVAFTLLNRELGPERVFGLLVDTGLMRKNEIGAIRKALHEFGYDNLHVEDASDEFFRNLEGVTEPEAKRKIIGDTFLAVQRRVSEKMGLHAEDGWMLGQGTIYPDTIETGGTKHADQIKTHHNRVPAVQELIEKGLVLEPLKDLYKDEVRRLGEELGLPHELVWRHPFPGPGLGVRILCAKAPDIATFASPADEAHAKVVVGVPHMGLPVRSVGVQGDGRTYRHAVAVFLPEPERDPAKLHELATRVPNALKAYNRVLLCLSHDDRFDVVFTPGFLTRERADLLREADAVVDEVMREAGLYEKIWQFPVVLLPFGMIEGGQSVVLRPISSTDAMTADAFLLPPEVLTAMTDRLMALPGIEAVFLDLTSKPPATIEWE